VVVGCRRIAWVACRWRGNELVGVGCDAVEEDVDEVVACASYAGWFFLAGLFFAVRHGGWM